MGPADVHDIGPGGAFRLNHDSQARVRRDFPRRVRGQYAPLVPWTSTRRGKGAVGPEPHQK